MLIKLPGKPGPLNTPPFPWLRSLFYKNKFSFQ